MNEREANHEPDMERNIKPGIEPGIDREPMTEADQQPVPIATAPSEVAAHLLRHVLLTQEIESFVLGGTANQMMYWGSLIEVRLEVRRCDYERAREALEAFVERAGGGQPDRQVRGYCVVCGYDRSGLAGDAVCPECGSPPSLSGIDVGQFRIVGSPGDPSQRFALFIGATVLLIVVAVLAVGAANVMGLI